MYKITKQKDAKPSQNTNKNQPKTTKPHVMQNCENQKKQISVEISKHKNNNNHSLNNQ
eukprot:GDKH01014607.1.p2 GENE.GDKH01014607.1~~GDKH01014607.1.p2  ORF type:complete len:58 (-),score=3.43 GDKH01014607.1:68-241(-)